METKRRFNQGERTALFLASGGRCEICGTDLVEGWHADHVHAWSRGGPTHTGNGQALCATCNMRKGASSMTVELREWQARGVHMALAKFRQHHGAPGMSVFVAGVSVGAGKTIFGSAVASQMFRDGLISRVIVVSPGEEIKSGWAKDMSSRFSLNIRRADGNNNLPAIFPSSEHGYATTYQSVDAQPDLHRRLCASIRPGHDSRTLVILDEAHHIGVDGNGNATTWAQSVRRAFDVAAYVLVLTGTPGRADGLRIPFVTYDDTSATPMAKLDIQYAYGRAVNDGIVRRTAFRPIQVDGTVSDGEESMPVSTADKKGPERTALEARALNLQNAGGNVDGAGADAILDTALVELHKARRAHKRAALLAVCDSVAHAKYISQCLRALGEKTVTVHSEDPASGKIIESFQTSDATCIVAVQMVAEGVNIPRLRVCAYLTRRSTPLALEQIMGRIVRVDWQPDGNPNDSGEPRTYDSVGMQEPPGEAVFVHLNKKELMEWSKSVEDEMAAWAKIDTEMRCPECGGDVKTKPRAGSPCPHCGHEPDGTGCFDQPFPEYDVTDLRATMRGEQIGGHQFDQKVVTLFAEFRDTNPDVRIERLAGNKLMAFMLNREAESEPTAPSTPHNSSPSESYADKISRLRRECDQAVSRYGARRKWNGAQYKELHGWANRQANIRAAKEADAEALALKLSVLKRYISENP